MPKLRRSTIACALAAVGLVSAISYDLATPAVADTPYLSPEFSVNFRRVGAALPGDAALSMFHACAARSPQHFTQHLLLGVCDGPIATLQKFAECLHTTKFTSGAESFTVYDLPKGINADTIHVVASGEFDSSDKQVAALQIEAASTYYGERFTFVDVAAEGYDGREYQTRIVVALVHEQWFAMPRCRSSRSFYKVADAMQASLPSPDEVE